jgi:hypothetical protein
VQRADTHTDAELTALMQKFRSSNKKLTEDQQNKIFWSLKEATGGGDQVVYKLLDYYIGMTGQDMRPMTDKEEDAAKKQDRLMETKAGGDTLISKRAFALDNSRFGPLLIHEFSHTGQKANWLGMGDYQEGFSYAIEYFYAEKTGSPRAAEILSIVSTSNFAPDQKAAIRQNFRSTYGALSALRDLGTTGTSTVTPLKGLKAEDGPSLTAKFIASVGDPPAVITKLLQYVQDHPSEFKIPPFP